MADNSTKLNNTENSSEKPNNKPEKSVESKLGDLMMQGWTMLADSCFLDSCSTPLMKDNVTKQIYCCGCEAWVVNKERKKEKAKFNEIVSLEGRRNMVANKKNTEITKIDNSNTNYSKDYPSFREVLERKLIDMSQWLQNEKCPDKCNSILDAMKKIMEMLKGLQINNQIDK